MTQVGQREILTQKHVVQFFKTELGYDYLGHWQDRVGNSNIEQDLLRDWLRRRGHGEKIIGRVLYELDKARAVSGSKTLYDANREVYALLRYGVKIRPEPGEQKVTVWLIDWKNPDNNDFAIAEEVTVAGVHDKRPDLGLYVNGIALGVLELKRSTVSVTEGIRPYIAGASDERQYRVMSDREQWFRIVMGQDAVAKLIPDEPDHERPHLPSKFSKELSFDLGIGWREGTHDT